MEKFKDKFGVRSQAGGGSCGGHGGRARGGVEEKTDSSI